MAEYEDYYETDQSTEAQETVDETTSRNTWEILTWIFIAFTITLNLVLIAILVLRRNLNSVVNKSENILDKIVLFFMSTLFSHSGSGHLRPDLWLYRLAVLC